MATGPIAVNEQLKTAVSPCSLNFAVTLPVAVMFEAMPETLIWTWLDVG